jgi:tetratricopeptide (TPR) repeat protein
MSHAPSNNPAEHQASPYWLDAMTVGIIGGFSLLAVIVLIVMWPGYQEFKHIRAANDFSYLGQYEQAIPHWEWLVAKHPDQSSYKKKLGEAYLHSGKPEKALEAYQQTAKLNPADDLNEEFGIVYTELKNDRKAMEYFSKVLAAKPDSPGANYYLGVKYFKEKKWFEAAKCFQAAAGSEIWDKKADPYRRELAKIVLGAPAEAEKAKSNG